MGYEPSWWPFSNYNVLGSVAAIKDKHISRIMNAIFGGTQIKFGNTIFIYGGDLTGNSAAGEAFQAVVVSAITTGTGTSGGLAALTGILEAGYTGPSATYGIYGVNHVAGTETTMFGLGGNTGTTGDADADTVGTNIGVTGIARNGLINVGTSGCATDATNNPLNVGTFGIAQNGSINFGGFFCLWDPVIGNPTFLASLLVGSALACSNYTTTDDIFQAYDNETLVFRIADGGLITSAGAGGTLTDLISVTRAVVYDGDVVTYDGEVVYV